MKYFESKSPGFHPPVRGRGALENPSGRFERLDVGTDAETFNALLEAGTEEAEVQVSTEVFYDTTRSIIATNESPDIGMEATINPYRGCEHGCIYCYARPGHEYFGLSAGLDFETKIFAKPDAPALLIKKLSLPGWQPKVVTLSGVTDCYQPLERRMKITRGCLEVLRDFRNPAVIITKNNLVVRDVDIFKDMAAFDCISINISVTTLDGKLARMMEPRASQPALRLKAIEVLAKENIPVGIMIGPVLPGLTEHEIPAILKAVSDAGARSAHYTMLRLPYGVKDLFQTWLGKHYPDRANKVLNRLREMRSGKLYDSEFGTRMRGTGVHADHIAAIFALYKKKHGLDQRISLTTAHFRREVYAQQLSFFNRIPDSAKDALSIQQEMCGLVRISDDFKTVKMIAGIDVGYDTNNNISKAALVVMGIDELAPIISIIETDTTPFPYIPGLLSFREAPVILKALAQLKDMPDMIFIDGQGIAHPRRLGIASHIGVLTDLPTIGVAKSVLCGHYKNLGLKKGSQEPLIHKNEKIGTALRSRDGVKPLFISPGHRVGHESAVSLVLRCLTRYRLPEPTRIADKLSKISKI